MASTSVKEFRGRGHAVVVAAPLRELQDSGSKVALNPKASPTSSPTEDIYQRSGSHQPVTAVHLHPFGCKEQIQTLRGRIRRRKINHQRIKHVTYSPRTHRYLDCRQKNAPARQKVAHACGNARRCAIYVCAVACGEFAGVSHVVGIYDTPKRGWSSVIWWYIHTGTFL